MATQGTMSERMQAAVRAWPVALALVLAAAVAAVAIRADWRAQRTAVGVRLESVAELRAHEAAQWQEERLNLAYFIDDSTLFAEQFLRWQDHGDAAAGRSLLERSIDARHAAGCDSALLIAADGRILAQEHGGPAEAPPELRAALQRALAEHNSVATSIYRRPGEPIPVRMDIVVPLLKTGAAPRGAMVLRVDPRRTLFPAIGHWPMPSRSGELVLWDRVDGSVVNLSAVQQGRDDATTVAHPLASSGLPVARAIRGDAPASVAVPGVDYRGVDVIAVARPVRGTSWWVVAKIDADEVEAPVRRHAVWVVGVALVGMIAVVLGGRLIAQRRALLRAAREHDAQARQLQSLTLLQAIARSATEAVYAKDLAGRYIFCNRAGAATMGLEPDDLLGRTDVEIFGPEVGAAFQASDRAAIDGTATGTFEERVPAAHGPAIILTTKNPLRDAAGTLLGVFGISRDVTALREAASALRESEEHYRTVVSALREGVLVCDREGRVVSCNPAAERLSGSTIAAWRGRSVVAPGWHLRSVDGSPATAEELPIARVLAGEPALARVPVYTRSPDGVEVAWELSATPVISPVTGELVSVVASFDDVTERRRLEAELRRHRDDLEAQVTERTQALTDANASLEAALRFARDVTDAIPGLVTYWDTERRCRFVNRAFLDFHALAAVQVLGRTRTQVFGAAHERRVEDRFGLALRGEPQRFETDHVKADGQHFLQVHYRPARDGQDAVVGVYVLAFDISALKRAEGELVRTNEALERSRDLAEGANRAKSAFVANMSHEIRTPLNGILGLAHLLARDPRDALQAERLAKIHDAGQHLLQIINDILDFSKIEAGKLVLEEADFSLDTLVATACDMVAERARAKGLELVVDTDHVPSRLRGDPTRLSQVFINLLSNAVKFTEHGWVRVRGLLLREEADRVHLRFEVQDTGPGIAEARQPELFNAFEQGDNSTTRRYGGTGLGLSLTRRFVDAMGGEVGLVSAPGHGSTFWFTCWLQRSERAEERAAPQPLTAMRVLLVDDLPEAARAISTYLENMGLAVDAPLTGDSALRRLEQAMAAGRPYDLVLLDSSVDGAVDDGAEDGPDPAVDPGAGHVLARMRALMGEGMPPTVLMGPPEAGAALAAVPGASFDVLLPKPVTASALHDVVSRLLFRRAPPVEGPRPPEPVNVSEALVRERHAGQRVLLAEDNLINRMVARELLVNAGLVVELAEDGAAALALATTRPYDLVLMDMQMPVMDGLESARRLRDAGRTEVPIIAMTANAFAEDRAACLAAGMNDHVAKPVDPSALHTILLRWLPRRVEADR